MIVPVYRSVRLIIGYIVKIQMRRDASDACDAAQRATGMPSASPALSHPILRVIPADELSAHI